MRRTAGRFLGAILSICLVLTSSSFSTFAEGIDVSDNQIAVNQSIEKQVFESMETEQVTGTVVADATMEYDGEPVATGTCGTSATYEIYGTKSEGQLLLILGTGMVESVNDWADSYKYNIKTVRISEGITSLGYSSFSYISSLTDVIFDSSDTLTTIGASAFKGCSSLKNITIPSSVRSIGTGAFKDCTSLETIKIPNAVSEISSAVFSGCSSLTDARIPNSVTQIGTYAFEDCVNLKTVNLSDNLTSIGEYAFKNVKKAFEKEDGSVQIIVPNTVTTIGVGAFEGIPATYYQAPFEDCGRVSYSSKPTGNLGSVFGYSTTESDEYAGDYASLSSGTVYFKTPKTLKHVRITTNCYVDSNTFQGNKYLEVVEFLGTSTTTSLGYNAFYECSSLKTVVLPVNLKEIGSTAFYNCSSLENIIIPSNVKTIDDNAFMGCTSLHEITIPSSVTTLGGYVFGKSGLRTLTIPSSVTSIGSKILSNCNSVVKVVNNSSKACDLPSSDYVNEAYPKNGAISSISKGTAIYSKFKVTLNANGGSPNSSKIVTYNTSYAISHTPTRLGYVFEAWYTEPEGGTKITYSTAVNVLADHTVYAHWTPNTYTVTLNPNGGELDGTATISVKCDQAYGELPTPTKEGKVFAGWYIHSEDDGEIKVNKDTTVPALVASHTLYAHWVDAGITVTFNSNYGDTPQTQDVSANIGEAYGTLPVVERDNYDFQGWFTDTQDGSPITEETIITETEDHTLYAHWRGVEVNVIFDGDGAEETIDNITVHYMETFGELPTPSKAGMDFAGWFMGETEVTSESVVSTVLNITLKAHWTPKTYTVYFDANGGTVSIEEKAVIFTKAYGELPTPEKEGYEFVGWFTSGENASIVSKTTPVSIADNHTLYAKWRGQAVTVTLNPAGGSVDSASVTVYYDGEFGELPVPVLEGYDFLGWYKGETLIAEDTIVSDKDSITLTAHWKIKLFTVSFVTYDDISTNEIVEYNNTVSKPEDPVRENHKFTGWKLGENIYDFDTPVTESFILHAGWMEKGPAPVISADRNSSRVIRGTKLILSSDTEGVRIYYTTDGTVPTSESNVYGEYIVINSDMTVKAITIDEDYQNSNILELTFTVYDPSEEEIGEVDIDDVPDGDVDEIPDGLWIAGLDEDGYVYTGKTISPDVRIYWGKTLLVKGRDYTITYSNNTKVGSATQSKNAPTITVKGKGNYCDEISTSFNILKQDISKCETVTKVLLSYNKKSQKYVPSIKYNGKTLVKNTDYTVTYSDSATGAYKAAGTYSILVKGINNFSGEFIIEETITADTLISKATVEGVKNLSYTGEALTQSSFIVKYNKKTLVAGEDYTVSYLDNTEIGTATIVIKGTNNATERGCFTGEKKVTFKISGISLSDKKIKLKNFVSSFVYTGEEIEQPAYIEYDGTVIQPDEDYIVTYSKNVNVGTATVVYRGINGFSGTIKKTYKITGYDIKADKDEKILLEYENEVPYSKGGAKPNIITLKYGDEELIEGADYKLEYKNNTAINDGSNSKKLPTMTIVGKGRFKGKIVVTDWVIVSKELSADGVTIEVNDIGYSEKKNGWKSGVTVTDSDGKVLKLGKDYSANYTYANSVTTNNGMNRAAGDAVEANDIVPVNTLINVEVIAKSTNYCGTVCSSYEVKEKSITSASYTIDTQEFTGKELRPDETAIHIKVDGVELVFGTDYEIDEDSYKNNIKKGSGYVTVKGIGNYAGKKTLKFTIKAKKLIIEE